jgi:hypothetical protein
MKKEKETQKESHLFADKPQKGLYGLDPSGLDSETSLLSVNFATPENPYFNDHLNEES